MPSSEFNFTAVLDNGTLVVKVKHASCWTYPRMIPIFHPPERLRTSLEELRPLDCRIQDGSERQCLLFLNASTDAGGLNVIIPGRPKNRRHVFRFGLAAIASRYHWGAVAARPDRGRNGHAGIRSGDDRRNRPDVGPATVQRSTARVDITFRLRQPRSRRLHARGEKDLLFDPGGRTSG